jgi:hypothetical protein
MRAILFMSVLASGLAAAPAWAAQAPGANRQYLST